MLRLIVWTTVVLLAISPAGAQEIELLGKTGSVFRVVLRAINGCYLVADEDRPIIANREHACLWETFDLHHLGEGWYALQSHYNKKFVRFAPHEVRADQPTVTRECRFRIHIGCDSERLIAISTNTGRFVTCEGQNALLTANREKPAQSETFQLSFPTEYEPLSQCPPGMQRMWVEPGAFRAAEFAIGVPGISFDTYFIGPPGAKVAGMYFLIGNDDDPVTLDGETVTKVHVAGIYGEACIQVPYACWVYYRSSPGNLPAHWLITTPIRFSL